MKHKIRFERVIFIHSFFFHVPKRHNFFSSKSDFHSIRLSTHSKNHLYELWTHDSHGHLRNSNESFTCVVKLLRWTTRSENAPEHNEFFIWYLPRRNRLLIHMHILLCPFCNEQRKYHTNCLMWAIVARSNILHGADSAILILFICGQGVKTFARKTSFS